MVDTQRTQSDLLSNLFQDDQAVASISAQDVRDLIVSLTPPFGALYISTSAATTINSQGAFVKAAGTTTSTGLQKFTMSSDNRLTYTGVPDRHMHIKAVVSITLSGNNDNITVAIAKNDTVIEASKMTRFLGTGSDRDTTSLLADTVMSTNDYIEIFVTNEDATDSVTLEQGYMFAVGVLIE